MAMEISSFSSISHAGGIVHTAARDSGRHWVIPCARAPPTSRDLWRPCRLRFGSTVEHYSSVRTTRTVRRIDLRTTMWYVVVAVTVLAGFLSILVFKLRKRGFGEGRHRRTSRSKTEGPCNILPDEGGKVGSVIIPELGKGKYICT